MFIACQNGHIEIVKYLVEHGADINKRNNDGWSPLLIVCFNGHIEIVKYLMEHGADIKDKDRVVDYLLIYTISKLTK